MRATLLYFILLFSWVILGACLVPKEKTEGEEIIILRTSTFAYPDKSLKSPLFNHDLKVWHKGQFAIEQITRIHFYKEAGIQLQKEIILGYIFIDAVSKSYYCYKTFTDTATALKEAAHLDTIRKDLGWNFYNTKPLKYQGTPVMVRDTTIDGINYKRLQYDQMQPEGSVKTTAFFRCDKKGSIFTKDTALSQIVGCPLTWTMEIPVDTTHNIYNSKFIFVSNTFNIQEQKVFAAWEKNARENPVVREMRNN